MARVIEHFEKTASMWRRTKYPWKDWADGQSWQLVRGEDYTVDDEAMRSAARMYARRMGLRLSARKSDVGLKVRFEPVPPVKKLKKLKRTPPRTNK